MDSSTRVATFRALRPALKTLASEAGTDPCVSADARQVLRAVARTGPEATLAVAELAARGNIPKTRIPGALVDLEAHGYLARLAEIAPHLAAALPATASSRHAGYTTIKHHRNRAT